MTDTQTALPGMPEPPPPPPPQPFQVKGSAETRIDLTIDLAGLIRMFPREYGSVDLRGGYRAWERPMVFLWQFLEEMPSSTFIFRNLVSEGWTTFEFDEQGRWSAEQFEELCEVCPEARVE